MITNSYSKNYKINGTAYIETNDIPFSKKEILDLGKYCKEVNKEFIEIGDAGEKNHLLVGRFMTDVKEPKLVDNEFTEKVIKIISSKKILNFIKKICNCNDEVYIRRAQYNEITEGCFVGYHLDKDSNPDYLAACVIQFGTDFSGGLYRVYNKSNTKKFIDYKPEYGSLLVSDCDYPHEVTKVEKGSRGSLVFFVSKNNGKNNRYQKN